MAKLGEQIKKKKPQRRLSRTERELREEKRQEAKQKFQRLKEKAKSIREQRFKNIKSVDEYRKEYNKLDPELKQFFATPKQVEKQRQQKIQEVSKKLDERIEEARKKKKKEVKELKDYIERLDERADRYEDEGRERSAERWEEKEEEKEDELEEKERYWNWYIRKLKEGRGRLKKGKLLSYKDIERYADDYAEFEQEREERENEAKRLREKYSGEIEELKGAETWKEYARRYADLPELVQEGFETPLSEGVEGYYEKKRKFEKAKKELTGISKEEYSKKYKELDPEIRKEFPSPDKAYKRVEFSDLPEKQQEQILKEYRKERAERGVDIPYIQLEKGEDLPYGYGGQQTISTSPTAPVMSREQYFREGVDLGVLEGVGEGVSKVVGGIGEGFEWVSDRVSFALSEPKYTSPISLVSPQYTRGLTLEFGKREEPTDVEKLLTEGQEGLTETQKNIRKWAVGGEGEFKEFEEEQQQQFQSAYQSAFEQEYGEQIIKGEKTFEEAKKEFEESKEAELLEKEYEQRYQEEFKGEILEEGGIGRKIIAGTGVAGLEIGKTALGIVKSPVKLATAVGVGYGVVKGAKYIPASVSRAINIGFTGYGAYKTFDPSSSLKQTGFGAITLGVGGFALGRSAYRYMRKPVISTKPVRPSVKKIQQQRLIGFERGKIVTPSGKALQKTVYPRQTLSRQVISGRRTVVTSRGRQLVNRLFGKTGISARLKPIYKGIPYTQPKAYTKAFKRLRKYGFTPYKARETLRFRQPQVIQQEARGVNVLVSGRGVKRPYSLARSDIITTKPKYTIRGLGIKTRGGVTTQRTELTGRTLLRTKGNKALIREYSVGGKGILTKSGRYYNKLLQTPRNVAEFSRRTIALKTGDVTKGTFYRGADDLISQIRRGRFNVPPQSREMIYLGRDYRFQDISNLARREAITFAGKRYNVLEGARARLVKTQQPTRYLKDRLRILGQGKGYPSTSNINRLTSKIDDISNKATQKTTRSFKQIPQKTASFDATQTLKTLKTPTSKVQQVKKMIRVKEGLQTGVTATTTQTALTTSLAGATALQTSRARTQNVQLRSQLTSENIVDTALRSQVRQLTRQRADLRPAKQMKGRARPVRPAQPTIPISPARPVTTTPPTPTPSVTPTPFVLDRVQRRLKQRKTPEMQTLYKRAYLPDFTARVLGLDPTKLTESQAQKQVRKVMTGLEVRRPVRVV